MKFNFKILSTIFIVFVLLFSSFVILVNAGVLKLQISSGSNGYGSLIKVIWGQGCPKYDTPPDGCYNVTPKYCPKSSKGTSSDELIDNCQKCGCPANHECLSSGSCKLCDNPCSSNPCGKCESCKVVGDWCDGKYTCNPITPCCGNGKCESGESCSSCETDCGPCEYCGDGECNNGETCSSCSSDCGGCAYCASAQEEGGGLCVAGGTSHDCSSDDECP